MAGGVEERDRTDAGSSGRRRFARSRRCPWRAATRARFPSPLHVCACARSGQCFETIVHRHHEEVRRGANACRHERDDPGVVQSRLQLPRPADVSAHGVWRGRSSPPSPLLSSRRPAAMRRSAHLHPWPQRIEDMAGAHRRDAPPVLTRSASHRRILRRCATRGNPAGEGRADEDERERGAIGDRIARVDAVQLALAAAWPAPPRRPGLRAVPATARPAPRAALRASPAPAPRPAPCRTPNS